jgi:hypothetical protein
MTDEVTLNGLTDTLTSEEVPDLSSYAEEPTGSALKAGWYDADVIEGYATRKGHQFATEDTVSQKGDSRNLRLCFKIGERNLQESFNYRPTDFTPERLAHIKELREEFKGVKGKWADADGQRSSLAIAKLGQIQKAFGFPFKRTPSGQIVAASFVGQKVQVRVIVNDEGYNEVKEFAPAGSKATIKLAAKA